MPAPRKRPTGGCDALSQHTRAIGLLPFTVVAQLHELRQAQASGLTPQERVETALVHHHLNRPAPAGALSNRRRA